MTAETRGMSMADYHAIPALNASGAWTLSETCPAIYWHSSPMNPNGDWKRERKTEFDIGIATHVATLEPDEYSNRVVEVPFDSYHTKESRIIRDDAYSTDRTPLKPAEVATVEAIRRSIEADRDVLSLLRGGRPETTIEWTMPNMVPAKCRPDYMVGPSIVDVKTVLCAHKKAVSMDAIRYGWHLRAAWYMEGVRNVCEMLAIADPTAISYRFLCVEKKPPYVVEVYELSPRAIAWGELIMRRATNLFAKCFSSGHWPKYNEGLTTVLDLPTYAEYQLAERRDLGDFVDDDDPQVAIAHGNAFLAP